MSGPIEEPRPGEGRAYFLALRALSDVVLMKTPAKSEWHRNLNHALSVFQRTAESQKSVTDAVTQSSMLHNLFDIDSVITFSDGWDYWESLNDFIRGRPAPEPLDQQLFCGSHPKSEAYFRGIDSLANTHASQVVDWLGGILDTKPLNKMLDLGAGPGTSSSCTILR